MSQEPYDQYEEEDLQEPRTPRKSRLARREKGPIDLTGTGARIAATAVVIAIGVLIIAFALRPRAAEPVDTLPPEPTPLVDRSLPIETFTPGPTSVPPPLDEPTPEPTSEVASEPAPSGGTLAVGSPAMVAGTGGTGVNMRAGSGLTFDIVQILQDDTPVELIEGPTESDGYTWWKVRLADGTEGWLVQDFLSPA